MISTLQRDRIISMHGREERSKKQIRAVTHENVTKFRYSSTKFQLMAINYASKLHEKHIFHSFPHHVLKNQIMSKLTPTVLLGGASSVLYKEGREEIINGDTWIH